MHRVVSHRIVHFPDVERPRHQSTAQPWEAAYNVSLVSCVCRPLYIAIGSYLKEDEIKYKAFSCSHSLSQRFSVCMVSMVTSLVLCSSWFHCLNLCTKLVKRCSKRVMKLCNSKAVCCLMKQFYCHVIFQQTTRLDMLATGNIFWAPPMSTAADTIM